ncbi:hypothetical protein HISP_18616 (plasmid) [Haloarcula hispanica N601]|uniref:Uncharacterized protein n=2 Tax=Haloarcula hispanica TaxID=51589 RepID=W0GDN1_HALHI|nr:hypothetical protein HAH_5089 [Haloarcula hispanica ATCC 33960]AHF55895.1 hypothetical protein HISP_18616 [Haloarcula hispanica N601]
METTLGRVNRSEHVRSDCYAAQQRSRFYTVTLAVLRVSVIVTATNPVDQVV